MTQLAGKWLVPGTFAGEVLRLDETLSFWGGFDPVTGQVIDRSHPQVGQRVTGKVVVMPGSKGSSGTPGVFGESIRLGTGPTALVVSKADINLVAGALGAEALYGSLCPILLVDDEQFAVLASGQIVEANPAEDET